MATRQVRDPNQTRPLPAQPQARPTNPPDASKNLRAPPQQTAVRPQQRPPASPGSKVPAKPASYGDYYNQGEDEIVSEEIKPQVGMVAKTQEQRPVPTAVNYPSAPKIPQAPVPSTKQPAKPHSQSVKESPDNLAKSSSMFDPQNKKSKLRSESFSLSERKIAVSQNKIPGVRNSVNESILSEQEDFSQPAKNSDASGGDQQTRQKDLRGGNTNKAAAGQQTSQEQATRKSQQKVGPEELILCEYDYLKEIFEFMPRPRLLVPQEEAAAIPREDSDEMKNLVMCVKRSSCKSELEGAVSASMMALVILVIFYVTAMICIAAYSFSTESLISDIIILILISGTCIFLRKRALSGIQIMMRLELKNINTLIGLWNKAKYNLFGLNFAYIEEEGMEESAYLKLSYSESFKKRTRAKIEPKLKSNQQSKPDELTKDSGLNKETMERPELQKTIAVHDLEDMAHQNSLNQAVNEQPVIPHRQVSESANAEIQQPVYDDQVATQPYYSDLPPVEEYNQEGGYYYENSLGDDDMSRQNQEYPDYDQSYQQQYPQPYDDQGYLYGDSGETNQYAYDQQVAAEPGQYYDDQAPTYYDQQYDQQLAYIDPSQPLKYTEEPYQQDQYQEIPAFQAQTHLQQQPASSAHRALVVPSQMQMQGHQQPQAHQPIHVHQQPQVREQVQGHQPSKGHPSTHGNQQVQADQQSQAPSGSQQQAGQHDRPNNPLRDRLFARVVLPNDSKTVPQKQVNANVTVKRSERLSNKNSADRIIERLPLKLSQLETFDERLSASRQAEITNTKLSSSSKQDMKLDFTKLGSTLVLLSPKKTEISEPKRNSVSLLAKPAEKSPVLSFTTNNALVVLSKLHKQSPEKNVSMDEDLSRDDLAGEETRTNKRFYPTAQAFQMSQIGGREPTDDDVILQSGDQTDSPRRNPSPRDGLGQQMSRSKAKSANQLDSENKLESDGEGRHTNIPISNYKPKLKFEPKQTFIDPWETRDTSIKEVGKTKLESSTIVAKKPLNRSLLDNPVYNSVLENSLMRSNTKPFREVPTANPSVRNQAEDLQVSAVVSKAFKPNSILGILGIQKTER